MGAIGIKIHKQIGEHDLGASKFFGAPTIPAEWQDMFSDDVIFFAQFRLSDIAELDTENKLPHTGYLYLFLDVEIYPYQALAYYYNGEPNVVIDDFNEIAPQFSHLNEDWIMTFEPVAESSDGIRLFGIPSSGYNGDGELLLQFDPLAAGTGFLDNIDGYAYSIFSSAMTFMMLIRYASSLTGRSRKTKFRYMLPKHTTAPICTVGTNRGCSSPLTYIDYLLYVPIFLEFSSSIFFFRVSILLVR